MRDTSQKAIVTLQDRDDGSGEQQGGGGSGQSLVVNLKAEQADVLTTWMLGGRWGQDLETAPSMGLGDKQAGLEDCREPVGWAIRAGDLESLPCCGGSGRRRQWVVGGEHLEAGGRSGWYIST